MLIVEAFGALLMMPVFCRQYGVSGIWMSVFHSVSAFCNAGFDIMGDRTGPFSVEELLARLRVTIRRLSMMNSDSAAESSVYSNGKLKIDYPAGCAFLNDEQLKLTPIEFKLLCLLAKNTGKVLTHTYITQKIWGRSWDNDIASLRVFMVTLWKKLFGRYRQKSPDPELCPVFLFRPCFSFAIFGDYICPAGF